MVQRVTLSLPDSVVEDLDYISERLGVSRSALAAAMWADPLKDLRKLMPRGPSPMAGEDRRLRGDSVELIQQRVQQLVGMKNDLFSGM